MIINWKKKKKKKKTSNRTSFEFESENKMCGGGGVWLGENHSDMKLSLLTCGVL